MTSSPLKVVELFAGVGGFRLGLEKNKKYEIVWSNNWEPSTKVQHASLVYKNRFKVSEKEHSDEDIFSIKTKDIPNHDVLVGGFPCQDYSVATTLKNSQGLIGKKGVLWWSIHRILEEKGRNRPKYLFLENVDRLLKSPANQRGRDFAVMLKSLDDLGYAVEWRVINSADYGMPQKRHRVYFLGYHKTSSIYKKISKQKPEDWILDGGVLADAFKISGSTSTSFEINDDLDKISKKFNKGEKSSPFLNSGVMINGKVTTMKTAAIYNGKIKTLGSILRKGEVEEEFYIDSKELDNWAYLKGSKKIERTNAEGYKYFYSEGSMGFPDDIAKPSRTIITGEGGPSPSRFKHVIKTKNKHRRLTPLELERLNMFPDNHTKLDGITNTKRAFFMGNALVVGVVSKISESLSKFMD
ncbi:DNA (cytosine-5-)-methyltransferase [bacterium]|nr:DNA (cytosine-5-)-methyltransferase [bacterium]